MSRRGLCAALLLPLFGCGFSPVYAPAAGGAPSSNLAHVFVAVIPNRPGQELRQALQIRLEGAGASTAKRYTLVVGYGISAEAIGIQADSSSSFTRFKATANWSLLGAVPGTPPLATGIAIAQDGFSTIVNQYFYSDLYNDTIYRRMADNIADQIVLRLAVYFRDKAKLAEQ